MAIESDESDALCGKGRVLCQLGRYVKAVEAYNRTLNIDPGNGDTWLNKGAALEKLGCIEAALEA